MAKTIIRNCDKCDKEDNIDCVTGLCDICYKDMSDRTSVLIKIGQFREKHGDITTERELKRILDKEKESKKKENYCNNPSCLKKNCKEKH